MNSSSSGSGSGSSLWLYDLQDIFMLDQTCDSVGPYLGNPDTPYSNSIHSVKYVDINPIDPSQLILPIEPQAPGSSSSFATQPPFLPGGGIAGTLVSQRGGGGSSHLRFISTHHV